MNANSVLGRLGYGSIPLGLAAAGTISAAGGHVAVLLLVGAAGFAIAAVCPRRLEVLTIAALIVAVAALPSVVPREVVVHGHHVFLAFPLFLGAAAGHVASRGATGFSRSAWLYAGAMLLGAIRGYGSPQWTRELYGPVYVLCGYQIALLMPVRSLKRTLAVIIQASAIVSVGAAVFGYAVAGRDEGVAGVSDATTRFLSPATHLAFAVLCGCVAWAIVARLTREVVVAAVSAAAITFLGFSRNAVIGLAAAAAYAVIVSLSLRTAQRAAVIALSLVISGAALVSVADANRGPGGMPGASFVAREWDAYKTRVFSSLSLNLSVNSSNSSLKWRATENVFAERAWRHHRVLGEGLGAYYRPPLGSFDTFAGQTGRHYIHNTYLWLLAKTGLLGLAAFLAFVLCPLGSLVFRLRRDPVAVSLGAAIVGLLAIGFVVPVPNDLWAAPALGIAVGLSQRRAREVSA